MTTTSQDVAQGGVNAKLIAILIGVGLAAAFAVIVVMFLNSKPSPDDLAQDYINDNSGAFAKEVAEYMAANHWVLERLDREDFSKQVEGSISWERFPAQALGGSMYEVRAVASTSVGVSSPWASGTAEAITPFALAIDQAEESVVEYELDYSKAQFGTDLPSLDKVLQDIAKKYIADGIDAISGQIVLFIVGGNWFLAELGAGFVEDRIHDFIEWEYQPSDALEDDRYEVVAVARVDFSVEMPSRTATLEGELPFVLTITLNEQAVDQASPDFPGAYLKTDIPDVTSIGDSVGEVVDFVKGVDAAQEEAVEKAKEAVEAVRETDCREAAREAGVPENILDLIGKPKDERSGIENSILRRGLDAVGLSDVCAGVE